MINKSNINKLFIHGNHIMNTYKNKKIKEEMFYNISLMLKKYYFQFYKKMIT